MEIIGLFIATFLFVYWVIWLVIHQKRKRIIEKAESRINEIYVIHGRNLSGTEVNSKRKIPHVPAKDRLNFNDHHLEDSFKYAQEPYVASNDYKQHIDHSSSFDHGFGGGSFSGGGAGGSWDDSSSSSSYDSGSSDSSSSND